MTEIEVHNAGRQVSKRQAVLVPGMHRSGSSALSGMLAMLGAQPPRSLMPPTKDNPRGYWESVVLMGFHDEIFASAGTGWSDWGQFNPTWMESPIAEDFRERLPAILEQEYGQARLLLVKDPRVCRLLPFWLQALSALDITPKIVLPLRHPMEVARSLGVRDDLGRHHSQLMWLRHVLDAEFSSRGCERVLVSYADILADWRMQATRIGETLDIKWPRWSGSSQAEIDAFLVADLRHHAANNGDNVGSSELAGWPAEVYQALLQLAAAGPETRTAMDRLDNIREELNRSGAIYAPVVHETEKRLERKLDDLAASYELSQRDGEASRNLVAGLQNDVASLHETLSFRDAELAAMKEKLQITNALMMKASQSNADLQGQVKASQVEISRMASEHVAYAAEMQGQVDALRSEIRELGQLKEEKGQVEESLRVRFSEIAKLTAMAIELEQSVAAKDHELAEVRALRSEEEEEHKASLRALENELDMHRQIATSRQDQIRLMRESRAWKVVMLLRRMVRASGGSSAIENVDLPDDVTIRNSGLFDQTWYLRRYSDVRKKGMDPVKHYLRYGASEGRDPGPGFSTKGYLQRYPDVAASGLNPLLHYIRYGLNEGRAARIAGTREGA